MLIRPAIGDTDPIRYRRPTPDGQFSGNILDEAMRRGRLPIWPKSMTFQVVMAMSTAAHRELLRPRDLNQADKSRN
jgi:hypothetical protein